MVVSAAWALLCLLSFSTFVTADIYLHNPPGSNNGLNEQDADVQNQNRLFDSENNARGGYRWGPGPVTFFQGSVLQVEWTNQHACGENPNTHCEVILQYMCQDDALFTDSTGSIRDGDASKGADARNTIDVNQADTSSTNSIRGRHELISFYQDCAKRERNMGLFLADQLTPEQAAQRKTAIYTRQNPGGTRYGTECPEERDYYPYWHPSPWRDIAVLVSDESRCDHYKKESQNVKSKNYCSNPAFNNKKACEAGGGQWTFKDPYGIPAPICKVAPTTRDNHLGNAAGFGASNFNWTIPKDLVSDACVLRIRYNISTDDYDRDKTFASSNFDKSPIKDNPDVDIGFSHKLGLNINTDQYGRTFEDRTHIFAIQPRPSNISSSAKIFNVNVRGKKGNIVQVFPAVEYDYVPNRIHLEKGDYIHFQWTGSNFNPQGNDGQGNAGTDRTNLVQIDNPNTNIKVLKQSDVTMFDGVPENIRAATIKRFATLDQTNPLLNNANGYFNNAPIQFNQKGQYHYMCTRNNNYSNRSQKGTVIVG